MKRRCFHLSVSSPTNDYGPDFLLVEIGEQDVTRIKGMMGVLAELDADGLIVLDGWPEWYRGDPEYAAEETCARATVVALQRRGLIRAPGQDDLPWEQRQWVAASVAHLDAAHRDRPPMGREDLRDRIREAAYFKAEADGFRRDAATYWLEAE